MEKNLHSIQDEKLISRTEDKEAGKSGVCLEVFVPGDSDFFDGHFPSFKLFPAVAQIYLADRFAKKYLGVQGFVREMKRVKFPSPLFPGATVLLQLELDGGKGELSFLLCDRAESGKIYSSGTASI